MLLVYLQNRNDEGTDKFCSDVLCSEYLIDYLEENFVCYGMDLTDDMKSLSVQANLLMCSMLVIYYRANGKVTVHDVITSSISIDEVMQRLMEAEETYQELSAFEARAEEMGRTSDNVGTDGQYALYT